MILKPGKYVQRNGGIATVTRPDGWKAVGVDGEGDPSYWDMDGKWLARAESRFDLISEYIEPPVAREGWAVMFNSKELAEYYAEYLGGFAAHVREILL